MASETKALHAVTLALQMVKKSGLARKDGLRQRADKGWGVRYFLGDLIIHHSHISLCFHAREKPLLSRPRLPPCLHCPRAAPGGAADRGLALSRPFPPGRSAGNRDRGMRGMQGVRDMQGVRGTQGFPSSAGPRVLPAGSRAQAALPRSSNELLCVCEHTLTQEIAL